MTRTRHKGYLVVAAALAGSAPCRASAQDLAEGRLALVRDGVRPSYLEETRPRGLNAIRLPPPPTGVPPAAVRGIYLNAWVFGGSRFDGLVELADTTEVNTFILDVKDGTGYLSYRSSVPTAIEIGANGDLRVRDVRSRLATLRQHGIHPVARIVVARDPLLAERKPEWAIHDVDGGIWYDQWGKPWVDTYQDSVWIYAAAIAEEAVLMGFREIQFDYVRFPDEPPQYLRRAVYPARRAGESRRAGVRRNVTMIRDRLRPLGVPFTLDVFGLTTSASGDLGIGQVWEDLAGTADVILPMVYPSHYGAGAYGYREPKFEPYHIVRRALEEGLARSEGLERAAKIRPFLQSFSIRRARYTEKEIRAQIQAAYDLGISEWVLWNASGRYPPAAFEPADVTTRPTVADGTNEPPVSN